MLFLKNMKFKYLLFLVSCIFLSNCNQKNLIDNYCSRNILRCNSTKTSFLFVYYSPYNCIACDKILDDLLNNKAIEKNCILYFPLQLTRSADVSQFTNEIKSLTGIMPNIIVDPVLYSFILKEAKKTNKFSMTNPMMIKYNIKSRKIKYIDRNSNDYADLLKGL
jgi:hypothetical protein